MSEPENGTKWEFRALTRDASIYPFAPLSPEQEARKKEYVRALGMARFSHVPKPTFSGYDVKESIGVPGSALLQAGNIEYGLCQGMHAEETAISAFRSRHGRTPGEPPVLGIIAGTPGNLASPCGNCRDLMLEDLGPDCEIVSGTAKGGIAVVAKLSEYLFSDFTSVPLGLLPSHILAMAKFAHGKGERLVNDAYSGANVPPERKYHALIITGASSYFGARDVMCEYHPIYALGDAIRQARRAHDPFIREVVITLRGSDATAPHVMYRDRQHLVELNLQGELVRGEERDPPVYLIGLSDDTPTHAWRTSVKEWLPFAFTPRNFGPEFIDRLAKYYRSPR